MNRQNVVSIHALREVKKAELEDAPYRARVRAMNKLELLNEMVQFQEERTNHGYLSPSLIVRGRILFQALEENAETQALRVLSRSYRRHLDHELSNYLQTGYENRDLAEGG